MTNSIDNKEIDKYLSFLENIIRSENSEKKSLEILCDELNIYFKNIDKNSIKYLIKTYGEETAKEILFKSYDKKETILQTQIKFEIQHRALRKPFDFLIRRHDFLEKISYKSSPMNLFNLISPFAKEFSYSQSKINEEIFKLLSLRYLNYY